MCGCPSTGSQRPSHLWQALVSLITHPIRCHPNRATGCADELGPYPYRGPGQAECCCQRNRSHQQQTTRHPGRPNAPGRERPVLDCVSRPSDRRGPGRDPGAAMCVQGIDVQCVLQFTLINAAGCALHRCTSRVIHRSELSLACSRPPPGPPGLRQDFHVNRTFTNTRNRSPGE